MRLQEGPRVGHVAERRGRQQVRTAIWVVCEHEEAQGSCAFWPAGSLERGQCAHALPVSPSNSTHPESGATADVGVEGSRAEDSAPPEASEEGNPGRSAEGEAIEVPEEEEEVQPQRPIATPATPSQAEMAEHRANGHALYRNWCPDCVEGFR